MDTNEELAARLVAAAKAKGLWLAAAESCTGGLAAGTVTAVPGASEVFLGGVVSYAVRVKREVLGVPRQVLESVGPVSAECAGAMAEGVRRLLKADVAVSVTGIAGPGGGTAEKPVGLVWFGLATAGGTRTERRIFGGGRADVRRQAVGFALGLLLEGTGAAE
jgi:nicotinamide-nucleotide amidase